MNEQNLLQKIEEKMPHFSKGQKKLANFILQDYKKATFITATKLGEIAGVSESTVVRFAMELGFDGYPKLQNELEILTKTNLSSIHRMQVSSEQISKNNKDILTSVLEKDLEKIKLTINTIDRDIFDDCVNKILNAKKVYIVGSRSSSSLATFLCFHLNVMLDNVILINSYDKTEMFDKIFKIDEKDVFIGISFPRYSKVTVKATQYAYSKNAQIIAITDSKASPLLPFTKNTLIVKSNMLSFIDSLVAPLSLINAILVAISFKKKPQITKNLEQLETIWEENQVYEYDN